MMAYIYRSARGCQNQWSIVSMGGGKSRTRDGQLSLLKAFDVVQDDQSVSLIKYGVLA